MATVAAVAMFAEVVAGVMHRFAGPASFLVVSALAFSGSWLTCAVRREDAGGLESSKLIVMDLYLTPETEAKLNELAVRTHRGTDELLQEAVDHLVTYNEWVEGKVKSSLAAVERGETVPDEEVLAWLERRERS